MKKHFRIKDHKQICAESFIDEFNGTRKVEIMHGEHGAWWSGCVMFEGDFNRMFEYGDEVDRVLPAAVAAAEIQKYAMGITRDQPAEDELKTQQDWEETLNCDEEGNVW